MGTDNLFHKRKAKRARDLARRAARRAPYAKVLIVCEGEKSEPHYFYGLKDHYGLNSANVEVSGEAGSDPVSLFTHARQRYREEKDAGDPFDRVYCVFDQDTHANYPQALTQIEHAVPKGTFHAITSVPCFEYWLLLHYHYTTQPYAPLPGNSVCNQVIAELKGFLPGYEKGQRTLFATLQGQLEFAKENAERALKAAAANHTDNPSTRVHRLVEFLQQIKEPK